MDWPACTGKVVSLLEVPEHRVTNLIRLGKVAPPLVMGRRAWSPAHVLRVAKILGKDSIEVRSLCNAATTLEAKGGQR